MSDSATQGRGAMAARTRSRSRRLEEGHEESAPDSPPACKQLAACAPPHFARNEFRHGRAQPGTRRGFGITRSERAVRSGVDPARVDAVVVGAALDRPWRLHWGPGTRRRMLGPGGVYRAQRLRAPCPMRDGWRGRNPGRPRRWLARATARAALPVPGTARTRSRRAADTRRRARPRRCRPQPRPRTDCHRVRRRQPR